ncbi:MAG: GtrA family protein [Prevotella sp.]|nr:GtrA family protein [Prevotella sp.]
MKTIWKLLKFFWVRPTEWLTSAPLMAVLTWLNYLVVARHADAFFHTTKTSDFFAKFVLSGFDSLYYSVLTTWHHAFSIFRHPLLADLLRPWQWLNSLLHDWTGLNLAPVIVAVLLLVNALYAYVFIYRIMRRVVGIGRTDGVLLTYLTFSFAYIMLAYIVPDHFAWSMTLLAMTTYLAGWKMTTGERLTKVQTIVIFLLTAGVTLSNGVKTYIMALFTNGRRFWRPGYLLLAVLLPAALMWGYAHWQNETYIVPRELKKNADKKAKNRADYEAFMRAFADTTSLTDSAEIASAANRLHKKRMWEEHERNKKFAWNANKGKPISNDGFGAWTDISTPRWESTVENLLGEGLQLHRDYLLQDALRTRPAFVSYRAWYNYAVEALIVLLFASGIWAGRRSRFLWMCLSCMAFDLLLHIGLGFGLNEVYIMTAHWAYVIPIAIGFLFHHLHGLKRFALRCIVILLTLWLWSWNVWLTKIYLF